MRFPSAISESPEGAGARGGDPGTEGVRGLSKVETWEGRGTRDLDLERAEGVLTFNRPRRGSLLAVPSSGSSST